MVEWKFKPRLAGEWEIMARYLVKSFTFRLNFYTKMCNLRSIIINWYNTYIIITLHTITQCLFNYYVGSK